MGILDALLRKPRPYRVRKYYDRIRERVDKHPRIEKRIELLKMLDQIEPQIISMEEHPMSNFEQKKTAQYIKFTLKRIEFLIKEDKNNFNQRSSLPRNRGAPTRP